MRKPNWIVSRRIRETHDGGNAQKEEKELQHPQRNNEPYKNPK